MKKSNLWTGLAAIAVGAVLLAAVFAGKWDSSLACGFGGGALGCGLATVGKYAYWTSPKRAEQYQKRLEEERIQLCDELLVKLRDRSGRYAYLLGMAVTSVSILVLGILKEFGVARDVRLLVLYLGAYTLFQWAAGAFIFRQLKERY